MNYHCYVVSVQEYLVQFRDPASFGRRFTFRNILQQHIDKIVKTEKGAHDFFVAFHNYVNATPDALIYQF